MSKNSFNIIRKLTLISEEKQRQLLRNFSRLSIDVKLQIFDLQKSVFHRLKQTHNDVANNILTYCSLILSISQHIESNSKIDIKAIKTRAVSSKRDQILARWSVVRSLRANQMSYRRVSAYLRQHHRLNVAHSTLHKIWNELENEQ